MTNTLPDQTVLRPELVELMTVAHKQAAEIVAWHWLELRRWDDAGRPTVRRGSKQVPNGYFVLTPMQFEDIDTYLRKAMVNIEFLRLSVDSTVTVSKSFFNEYGVPRYKFQ